MLFLLLLTGVRSTEDDRPVSNSLQLLFQASLNLKPLLRISVFIHIIESTTNFPYKNFALILAFKQRPRGAQ